MIQTAAIALGSNSGDRRAHLDYGIAALRCLLVDLRASAYYETIPVDVPGDQPLFLNAAAVGQTHLSARELLAALLATEQERGRERPFPRAARTLDLDLILLGDTVLSEPDLQVPHARFRGRRFVLEPLTEIAPDLRDPVTGCTMRTLLERAGW